MACEVCEHCQEPLRYKEGFKIREGHSYHEKCHKCYVCSETDLQNAEVFRGVIFCSSCSQRIFQGCATARKIKTASWRDRDRSQKRRSLRTQDHKGDRRKADGILQLTTLAVSTDSDSDSRTHNISKISKLKISAPSKDLSLAAQDTKICYEKPTSRNNLKNKSAEIGMTTEVTQELLKQMKCPVVLECKKLPQLDKPKTIAEKERKKKKPICSDLRIAELGASTEIANMALKNKFEVPIIIKSSKCARVGQQKSLSLSILNQDSDKPNSQSTDTCSDSDYSSLQKSSKISWMDRRFGSILKLPYRAFKKNILTRSSLVGVLMTCENDTCLLKKIKLLFNDEVMDHRKRGLKRLYSTINRRNTDNKLGWPSTFLDISSQSLLKRSRCLQPRCTHFKTSHSYRCMRAQVMRLAGPTASELARFRKNVKSLRFIKKRSKRNELEYYSSDGLRVIRSSYGDEDS